MLAGTCAEYELDDGPAVLAEDAALAPATLYGVGKDRAHEAAQGVRRARRTSLAWGRDLLPLRRRRGDAPARHVGRVALLRGERAETTAGKQPRDFLHVDDVAGAFVALVGSPVTGAVNIGTGHGSTVREIAELTAAATGRPELLRAGSRPMRQGDPPSLVADVARLEREVGFRPQVSLADGIAATVAALRAG